MIYVYLFVMAVCAVGVVIERKDWKEKPEVTDRTQEVLSEVAKLSAASEHNHKVLLELHDSAAERVDSLAKKIEYLEVKTQNQKPPQVSVSVPEKIAVSIVSLPRIKGDLSLSTPVGKRMRVLHAPGVVKRKPATFESVKKQIEGLSK